MDKKPQRIVCAVRGSPQSRETVTRAIELALEHEARLTFFYVVDAEFHRHATVGPLSVIYHELVEMSEFTLLILEDRAQRRGVKQVDSLIWKGNVQKKLLQLVREVQPDVLVLGWPLRGAGRPRFKPAEFKTFVAELEREGNTHVEVVPALPG
jgi:nucleotide-binding universal stress UspA family protein